MSKSHRDNTRARRKAKKRGGGPWKKREKRRAPRLLKCNLCGGFARP